MGKKIKDLSECKHPNSRKTIALVKQIQKESHREKAKLGRAIKTNLIAEKISWFREQLLQLKQHEDLTICTHEQIKAMIEHYLNRFAEELTQIKLKQSIGKRKNSRQHAGREDAIKITLQRDVADYDTCGLEIPDFSTAANVEMVLNWNGETKYLQNIKLKRYAKKYLELNCKSLL